MQMTDQAQKLRKTKSQAQSNKQKIKTAGKKHTQSHELTLLLEKKKS